MAIRLSVSLLRYQQFDFSHLRTDITMVFGHGTLTIHLGIIGRPGLRIEAESETIMNLSNVKLKWGLPYYFDDTGQEIIAAIKSGRLKIKGMVLHFISLVRLSRVMSVHP